MKPPSARSLLLLLSALLLVPSFSWATSFSNPIPAASNENPGLVGIPHDVAFQTVERLYTNPGRYPEQEGDTIYFTRDQMTGILLQLHRARLFPSEAATRLELAQNVWTTSDGAYQASKKFYDVVLNSRAECVQLEANAWALLAAERLGNVTGRADVQQRAKELAETLQFAVKTGEFNDVKRCPPNAEFPPSQWAFPLYAMLAYAELSGSIPTRDVALDRLRNLIDSYWVDEAFRDPSGFHPVLENSQYLLALQQAVRLGFESEFGPLRDGLARFLLENALHSQGGQLFAQSVEPQLGGGYAPIGIPSPVSQSWAAYALHRQRLQPNATLNPSDAPERLLDSLVDAFWSNAKESLLNGAGLVHFASNALPALLTEGPRLQGLSWDTPRLAMVVPAQSEFSYPAPDDPRAANLLLSNEWTFRFNLQALGPQRQKAIVPTSWLGGAQFDFPSSKYTPQPVIDQEGRITSHQLQGPNASRFEILLESPPAMKSYRLMAYAPVLPERSELKRQIHLVLHSYATKPITIGLLTIDLDIENVPIQEAFLNHQPLSTSNYQGFNVGPTEFIPRPHVRLELRNLYLPLAGLNDLVVSYSDQESPKIEEVVFSRDVDGHELASPEKEEENFYRIQTGNPQYVRATVRDNAMLKTVALVVGEGFNASELRMTPHPNDAGVYYAALPALPRGQVVGLQVRAVDEHDNLNLSTRFQMESQSAFFREGSIVLLVFSGILFFSAAVIYFRMGRRRRP